MTSIPPRPAANRAEFVARLIALGESVGPLPLYGSDEWGQLPADDPRRFASVVRAAEAWRRDGAPDAIRDRLLREVAENNWLTAWRLRRLSGDLSEAEDWKAIARWTPMAELRRLRAYGTGVA
jgi:hypothetical protein